MQTTGFEWFLWLCPWFRRLGSDTWLRIRCSGALAKELLRPRKRMKGREGSNGNSSSMDTGIFPFTDVMRSHCPHIPPLAGQSLFVD